MRDESPRGRIVRAMVEITGEGGFEGASVRLVAARAGVSSRTFYEHFESPQDCFAAVLDLALEQAGALMLPAFARERRWQDGARDALASLLVFFDSEPQLTRVWFVEAMAAGSWAFQRRQQIAARLRTTIVEYWEGVGDEPIDPQLAIGLMASVLGLIQTHLANEEPAPLIELLGPLMGLVTAPFMDRRDAAREVQRADELARDIQAGRSERWSRPAGSSDADVNGEVVPLGDLPAILGNPTAWRARECLLFLADHPGASNREVALGIGVSHQSQISRLLGFLTADELVSKRSEGIGKRNAWRLTARGEAVARMLACSGRLR